MAFRTGISRERTRKRRRIVWRGALSLFALAAFVALGYSSYRTGSMVARSDVTTLEEEVDRLTGQLALLRSKNNQLQADLGQTRRTTETLKLQYDADVPSGKLATLVELVRERLQNGLPEARIAQVLREAEAILPCEGRAKRKRFAIHIAGQGKEESESLFDGLIQVSASAPAGTGTTNLAKATTVTIRPMWSEQPIKVIGMPVRQSITINNLQFQVAVEASEISGYAAISLSTCGNS